LTELIQAVRNLPKAMRDEAGPTLATGVLTPRGRIALAEATAAMSLLEGHADVIMDAVGPRVVRSIEQIRPKFDARRVAGGRLERAIRRLAGMDVKTAQYIQGAAFVRAVLAAVGHEGLNAAFAAPENLPDPAEIDHPAAWLARVHG
ncbi:MAG: zinc-dependent metalloprotease, partial [Bifidobacteriaceae bacterium]|nr:zinc-dependent metalloprotease [Bifidobacteriaceae bacterium]